MENTIENKRKFFALYMDQHFVYKNVFGAFNGTVGDFHFNDNIKNDAIIILKPFSVITKEEAEEVIRLYAPQEIIKTVSLLVYPDVICINRFSKNTGEKAKNSQKVVKLDSVAANSACADYLRSQGYAVPYMGLSVDKLVEYGWIKLVKA